MNVAHLEDWVRDAPISIIARGADRIDMSSDGKVWYVASQLFGQSDSKAHSDFISAAAFAEKKLRDVIFDIRAIDMYRLSELVEIQNRLVRGPYRVAQGMMALSVTPTAAGFRVGVRFGVQEAIFTAPTLMAVMYFAHIECQKQIKELEKGLFV